MIGWFGENGTSYSIIFASVVACGILLIGILSAQKSNSIIVKEE
jgi:hypothetical protein